MTAQHATPSPVLITDVDGLAARNDMMPWAVAVAHGLVPGCTRVSSLGTNPATAAGASFWYGTGAYPWIPSARTLEIVSSSANDSAAGTGARKVLVSGLDANFNPISETVTMNGTTAVPLVNTYLRVQQGISISAGSSQINLGTITIRDSGAGATRAVMPIALDGFGIGITSQTAYTVPAGFTLEIQSILLSINRTGANMANNVTIRNWFFNNVTGSLLRPLSFATSSNGPYRHEAGDGYPVLTVGQKTDVDFVCTDVTSSLSVTMAMVGTLVQNSTVLAA